MKKYFQLIIGTMLLFPLTLSNALGVDINSFSKDVYRPDNLPGLTSNTDAPVEVKINTILNFFINLILYASGGVAVFFLVYGAIQYITSLGGERKDAAKKTIKYALIGLAAVIFAYAIVTNVISIIFKATV